MSLSTAFSFSLFVLLASIDEAHAGLFPKHLFNQVVSEAERGVADTSKTVAHATDDASKAVVNAADNAAKGVVETSKTVVHAVDDTSKGIARDVDDATKSSAAMLTQFMKNLSKDLELPYLQILKNDVEAALKTVESLNLTSTAIAAFRAIPQHLDAYALRKNGHGYSKMSWNDAEVILGIGGTTFVAMLSLPVVLELIGFETAGVATQSVAAAWQSKIGNVQAGSVFSILQSIAMAGLAQEDYVLIPATVMGIVSTLLLL
mmetsp:Transcript_16228/g.24469  ORF Transcript_16228/g.24469 Transcript_16228/m.24469 type:complete len:261 (+) Transcript_16228:30-812(+)